MKYSCRHFFWNWSQTFFLKLVAKYIGIALILEQSYMNIYKLAGWLWNVEARSVWEFQQINAGLKSIVYLALCELQADVVTLHVDGLV